MPVYIVNALIVLGVLACLTALPVVVLKVVQLGTYGFYAGRANFLKDQKNKELATHGDTTRETRSQEAKGLGA